MGIEIADQQQQGYNYINKYMKILDNGLKNYQQVHYNLPCTYRMFSTKYYITEKTIHDIYTSLVVTNYRLVNT